MLLVSSTQNFIRFLPEKGYYARIGEVWQERELLSAGAVSHPPVRGETRCAFALKSELKR
jgi:hypothetical protein